MKSWHCRHCGTPRDKFRPSLRAWKLEKLLLEVRNLVVGVEPGQYITAEDIANKLRAKKSMVELCFHRLNLEGILSQVIIKRLMILLEIRMHGVWVILRGKQPFIRS